MFNMRSVFVLRRRVTDWQALGRHDRQVPRYLSPSS